MEAKQYAQRNRQGSDWFSHDKSQSDTTSTTTTTTSASPAEVCTDKPDGGSLMSAGDDNGQVSSTGRAQMIKPKCDSNQWYKYEQEGKQETDKLAHTTEGGAYCRRDKAGSASEWFSHDHPDGSTAGEVQQSALLKEGNANAARMRSESDSWFTHDKAEGQQTESRTSTRGQATRPVSSEMHGIFHHAGTE
jgi:hypothetical protein